MVCSTFDILRLFLIEQNPGLPQDWMAIGAIPTVCVHLTPSVVTYELV